MTIKRLQTVVSFRSEDGIEISDQRIRLLEAVSYTHLYARLGALPTAG